MSLSDHIKPLAFQCINIKTENLEHLKQETDDNLENFEYVTVKNENTDIFKEENIYDASFMKLEDIPPVFEEFFDKSSPVSTFLIFSTQH